MPKFLEDQLKKEYGTKSDVPYKIMNKLGFMRGNKETAKGEAAEQKHALHATVAAAKIKKKLKKGAAK